MDFNRIAKADNASTMQASYSAQSLVSKTNKDFAKSKSPVDSAVSLGRGAIPKVTDPKDEAWRKDLDAERKDLSDSLAEESKILAEAREEEARKLKAREEEKAERSQEKAKEVIAQLSQKHLGLRFETAKDYDNASIVNVIDTKSDEVIRQIPSEEFLRMADAIHDYQERQASEEMDNEFGLKSNGLESQHSQENLRGAMFDIQA